jgi:hypothetical protein
MSRHRVAIVLTMISLSACATTARLHEQTELNTIGQSCGLALGELFQDESEKRLLFMVRIEPTAEQRACVARWARKNGLKTVFVDNIAFPES